MASDDVIELGSSDDEKEPASKKMKPAPNAMVHFPTALPGLVIKPAKPGLPPLQKVLATGAVTITNIKSGKVSSQINKTKSNICPVQKFSQRIPHKINVLRPGFNIQKNISINPLNVVKNQKNIRIQGPKLNLPPGITVKRTPNQKIIGERMPVSKRRCTNTRRKQPEKPIATVELDDDVGDNLTSTVSPQWYLRPEEQVEELARDVGEDNKVEVEISLEDENNKEPEKSNFIEITIEDSPVKPVLKKDSHKVGADPAITIDDSPVKGVKEHSSVTDGSENETHSKERQSKKKLHYVKNGEGSTQRFVEIDLEKIESAKVGKDCDGVNQSVLEETESTKKMLEVKGNEIEQVNDNNEFSPVYQRFIDLCFKLENSDDMKKIVEKKIKTYYRQSPREYVESEEFIDMVSSKIFAMKAAPDKMYLYIKDIVDELNLQRKSAKAVTNKDNKKTGEEEYFCTEDTEYDSKRKRQIRKLEKTIKKLHRAIQKLDEQEVEFDDEEDSVYLLNERYKERLVRVYAKFCQLTKTKMPSEPRIQIEPRPGQPVGPAKKLEKFVNKKVPIGTPLQFPDFHDVLRCVREANNEDKLGWNEVDIMEEARDLFTRCGKKLQRRRQENEWRIAASRISHDVSTLDPADSSVELRRRLEDNKTIAAKKEIEIVNKYADKQNQLKLEAEEIGDKEANESPVESEDDEVNDDTSSLEDKVKRKDRIRRLLHEKTRKMSAEKENISTNEPKNNENSIVEKDKDEQTTANLHKDKSSIKEDSTDIVNKSVTEVKGIETVTNEKIANSEHNDYDTYSIDSDIDEMHLLQKLYSSNEIGSSTLESDSDSPIAISDTLESDSETEKSKKLQNCDIISIENSSYSESELTKDECSKESKIECSKDKKNDSDLLKDFEIELSSSSRSKGDGYDENILLASSDEEKGNTDIHLDKGKTLDTSNTCKGTRNDDNIKNDVIVEVIVNRSLKNDVVLDKSEESGKQSNAVDLGPKTNFDNATDVDIMDDELMTSLNEEADITCAIDGSNAKNGIMTDIDTCENDKQNSNDICMVNAEFGIHSNNESSNTSINEGDIKPNNSLQNSVSDKKFVKISSGKDNICNDKNAKDIELAKDIIPFIDIEIPGVGLEMPAVDVEMPEVELSSSQKNQQIDAIKDVGLSDEQLENSIYSATLTQT